MTRPTYEKDSDIANETEAARKICAAWKCEAMKLPKFYSIDWALVRDGKIKGWIEIKCRAVEIATYPTLILSLHKWASLMRIQIETRIPAFVIARFTDQIAYMKADRMHDIAIGGRKDREDWQDIEPVVHIPIPKMKRIKL